ncbi:hypothetical protein QR680_012171 [Steinernema hermaphroditum]|uniref:Uncharacterized protein n=1 Tax=Steinernema hermaphroditum TaxID=289476 RepID=A0AA39I164_9BILA|nr:hypothetical protein QR680_012171 [Steinernema hermaphroditum]
MFRLILFLFFLTTVLADCGCGPRCQKYSFARQCSRCCSATVRRFANYALIAPSGWNDFKAKSRRSRELQEAEENLFYELVANVVNRERRFNPRFYRR